MECECNNIDEVVASEINEYIRINLNLISVDSIGYKTLYKCKKCKSLWQSSASGRFNSEVNLIKVDETYVLKNWN